jgi:predicted nucleotidyltransferase
MKAVGIVIEYNPFTNGHKYHLEKTKELTNADVVVGVMSSFFVQRGEPSIVSKEERVRMALDMGVDLLVELPTIYTVESSDFFCKYSVSILNKLKVDSICFGSETGSTKEFLEKYSETEIVQPHLDFLVSDLMDEGMSYPAAMSKALAIMDSFRAETPNDILGLGYLKEIRNNKYPIDIFTYKRENNYNNEEINDKSVSASALRKLIRENKDISEYTPCKEIIESANKHYLDDYFDILKYKLLTTSSEELTTIHLVNEGIENLFKKQIIESKSMEEFINKCVSKRYTFARIKRTIIHILLNTKKDFAKEVLSKDITYIRILGTNKKGQEYLNDIRKEVEVPILSKFRGNAYPVLQFEKQANLVYNITKDQDTINSEYEKEHYLYPIRK